VQTYSSFMKNFRTEAFLATEVPSRVELLSQALNSKATRKIYQKLNDK
jgi:hypothetical protein